MKVTLYTDPGCPFGFNAQRQELQLMWHYGDAVDIDRRMIVLADSTVSFEERGMSPDMIARGRERLRAQYGMPMGMEPSTEIPATIDACRAYVGARMHAPDRSLALLRALRRRAHSDQQPLDDRATIHAAAADAGIAAEDVDAWLADADVDAALRADMAATRDPLPEALAQAHRLSKSDDGLRYSTSSGVFESDGRRVVAAGFQPFAVYEVAIASVAPEVERRPAAETVDEVLAWAPFPLATAEVAELRGIGIDQARDELTQAGATFTPSAGDGYWSS
jgi:predicted DsbA family dithiol-disulfide isomerase